MARSEVNPHRRKRCMYPRRLFVTLVLSFALGLGSLCPSGGCGDDSKTTGTQIQFSPEVKDFCCRAIESPPALPVSSSHRRRFPVRCATVGKPTAVDAADRGSRIIGGSGNNPPVGWTAGPDREHDRR
jgi:hypothetical protein